MRYVVAGMMALTLLASACGSRKPSADEQAVRDAIQAHLKSKRSLALSNMKMQFQSVTIKDDTAQAQVRFQSVEKPELAVSMRYSLRRVQGKWQVESSSPVEGTGSDSHHTVEAPQGGAAKPPAESQPNPSH